MLFSSSRGAFKQLRSAERARQLAYGILNCQGRSTITGMLTAVGKQFVDWTQAYRLFHKDRMDLDKLFSSIRRQLIDGPLQNQDVVYAHMDDTLIRKTGKKIHGTGWRRDPLGPPFCNNFIWGQRFLQLSVSSPQQAGPSSARAIPVDFHHCPSPRKPGKNASPEQWEQYKEQQNLSKISQKGVERVKALRKDLDEIGAKSRQVILSVDGSFTNGTVMRQLPERVTLIGRIRKDAKLCKIPGPTLRTRGRKRIYGDPWPTPEEIRKDKNYAWQKVSAFAAGKTHNFNVKVIKGVRWRKAGEQNLQLVIIRPLAYRPRKGAKMLYRKPAYLICTDPEMAIEQLLQAYLWRWEIEVNFRDEKSLIGCGQAQVRKQAPAEKVPGFMVAVYALLLLADQNLKKYPPMDQLPATKWYPKTKRKRNTTGDLLNLFKAQMWAKSAGMNFSHFVNTHKVMQSRGNNINPVLSAVCYGRK